MPNADSTPGPSPRAGLGGSEQWVVWSIEHNAWWQAYENGYTRSLLHAGTYSEAHAKECAADPVNETAMPLSKAIEQEHNGWSDEKTVAEHLRAAAQGGEDTRRLNWMQEVDPVIECRVSKSSEKRWEVWSVDSYEGSSLRAAIDRAMSAANAVSGRSPDHGAGGGER